MMLENDILTVDHISDNDISDIMNFSVKEKAYGLEDYLKYHAFQDEESGQARTYIVRDKQSNEFVGFYTLKAGLISSNERFSNDGVLVFDTLPGIELAMFALNRNYLEKHPNRKHLGIIIFDSFILPTVLQVSKIVGVYILYIFALPDENLIERYKKEYGFYRLGKTAEEELHKRIKPYLDESCIFMYQKIPVT